MIQRRSEVFDANWNPAFSPHGGSKDSVGPLAISPEGEHSRELLEALTRELIELGRLSQVHSCCLALAESFGPNSPAKAACWIMQLQAFKTRTWMRALWLRSLPPASPIAASIRRLETLQDQDGGVLWPDEKAMKQIEAEKSFLNTSSNAFRR